MGSKKPVVDALQRIRQLAEANPTDLHLQEILARTTALEAFVVGFKSGLDAVHWLIERHHLSAAAIALRFEELPDEKVTSVQYPPGSPQDQAWIRGYLYSGKAAKEISLQASPPTDPTNLERAIGQLALIKSEPEWPK